MASEESSQLTDRQTDKERERESDSNKINRDDVKLDRFFLVIRNIRNTLMTCG